MKKELKSGILSVDKLADCRPTVCGVNVNPILRILACECISGNASCNLANALKGSHGESSSCQIQAAETLTITLKSGSFGNEISKN